MWGNNGRQGETRPWEVGHTVQHRHTCEETMGDKGRQDVEKADTPSNKGKQEGRWERRGNKTSGRRTHHPTQADKRRQDRGKADTPRLRHHPRQAHMCGDNGRQNGKTRRRKDAPSNTGTSVGRQWETMGSMGEKGRQDVEKADTPSNKGKQEGRWERRGNKTSGRRTHHPTQADKRRQDRGKADTPRLRHHPRQAHMCGDNGRQNGKTRRRKDAPSNTGTSVGRQWETMGSMGEKGRQDLHRHTCGETMGENGEQWGTRGDQGDKTSKRRAHHPRKGNKKGGGRQWKTTRRDKTLGRRTRHPTQTYIVGRQWETRGDKERQGETRPREGGNAIRQTNHHRHTCGE